MAGAELPETTDALFDQEVLQSDLPVLVDFGATWCSPCKALKPTVQKIMDAYAGRLKVRYFDIGKHTKVPTQYGIASIPVLLLFKGGKERGRIVGLRPQSEIQKAVDAVLAS